MVGLATVFGPCAPNVSAQNAMGSGVLARRKVAKCGIQL